MKDRPDKSLSHFGAIDLSYTLLCVCEAQVLLFEPFAKKQQPVTFSYLLLFFLLSSIFLRSTWRGKSLMEDIRGIEEREAGAVERYTQSTG